MKKGTIFKNLWAGHETYFIYQGPARTGKMEASAVTGYGLVKINDKWKLDRVRYYCDTLRDEEHFPAVGHIDVDGLLLKSILGAIGIDTEVENAPDKKYAAAVLVEVKGGLVQSVYADRANISVEVADLDSQDVIEYDTATNMLEAAQDAGWPRVW